MMRIVAHYSHTAALAAGNSRAGTVEIQVSDEQIQALTTQQRTELASLLVERAQRLWLRDLATLGGEGDWTALVAAVDRSIAREADLKREEQEREVRRALEVRDRIDRSRALVIADPTLLVEAHRADREALDSSEWASADRLPIWRDQLARLIEELPEATVQAARAEYLRLGEVAERNRAERVAGDALEAEVRAGQASVATAENAAAVAHGGTESQIARYAAGVLPASELRSLLLDYYLPLVPGLTLSHVVPADLPDQDDGPPCGGDYEATCHPGVFFRRSEPLSALTEGEYAILVLARLAAPAGAVVAAISQRCECDERDCDAGITVRRIRETLTLPSGQVLTRRYAL